MCVVMVEERPVLVVVRKPLESPVKKIKPSSVPATITTVNRMAMMSGETPLCSCDLVNRSDLARLLEANCRVYSMPLRLPKKLPNISMARAEFCGRQRSIVRTHVP